MQSVKNPTNTCGLSQLLITHVPLNYVRLAYPVTYYTPPQERLTGVKFGQEIHWKHCLGPTHMSRYAKCRPTNVDLYRINIYRMYRDRIRDFTNTSTYLECRDIRCQDNECRLYPIFYPTPQVLKVCTKLYR